jgi:tripartite-type tricarboxylate transporter receptor subunit TctC
VAKSPPDGYTLLLGSTSLWIGPLLQKAPYETLSDFSPISLTTRAPLLLVVHPALPAKSVKELIALAKAKPGQLNYSTTAIGASTHLSAELFKAMAAVNIVRISYKTTSMQQADLLSGQVQLSFGSGPSMAVHVKSGRLRGLAVTSPEPSPLLPGFPTVAASGVPGYEFEAIDGILAPAKTPAAIINRLNQEMVRFLNSSEAKERFLPSGVEASGSSPEQLAARIKSETAILGKVIKDAGIRVD